MLLSDDDIALLVERVASAIEVETLRRLAPIAQENDKLRGEIRAARAALERKITDHQAVR